MRLCLAAFAHLKLDGVSWQVRRQYIDVNISSSISFLVSLRRNCIIRLKLTIHSLFMGPKTKRPASRISRTERPNGTHGFQLTNGLPQLPRHVFRSLRSGYFHSLMNPINRLSSRAVTYPYRFLNLYRFLNRPYVHSLKPLYLWPIKQSDCRAQIK
jgi:hypothetical protein